MVGTSSFCPSRFPQFEDCGEIISLYLLPEYMGKGYGKELLKTAISELSAQGFQEIFLWVLEENNRARHFYERCGFLKAADVIEKKIGGKNIREIRYVRKVIFGVFNKFLIADNFCLAQIASPSSVIFNIQHQIPHFVKFAGDQRFYI